MEESGFSIRCPHCFEWNDYPDKPSDIAISSNEEFRKILSELEANPYNYKHPKLFRCKQKPWECPARYEAFIFSTEKDALTQIDIPKAWSVKRDFRLYTQDDERWEDYVCTLFCTQNVMRQRNIELKHLLDTELLINASEGIGTEINAPYTVYLANASNHEEPPYWTPIEAKADTMIPLRFRKFCQIARNTTIKTLIKQFKADKSLLVHCENCYINECPVKKTKKFSKRINWDCCPTFLALRKEYDPCYISDCSLIRKVESKWNEKKQTEIIEHECYAGFTEYAKAIVVHDHLIAIAITGQRIITQEDIKDISEIIERYPILNQAKDELEIARQDLLNSYNPKDKRAIINKFKNKTQVIERVAKSHYSNIRRLSESSFKQELLGRIRQEKNNPEFFTTTIRHILNRMREFWAFKAAYLFEWNFDSEEVYLSTMSHVKQHPPIEPPGIMLGKLSFGSKEPLQQHPVPYLFNKTSETDIASTIKSLNNPFIRKLANLFDRAFEDPRLDIPRNGYYFIVTVPLAEKLYYAFIFAVRDENAVSVLRPRESGGVSEMCQDIILQTCTDVVHCFSDAKVFQEKYEQSWRLFSGWVSHRIGNEINIINNLVWCLKRTFSNFEKEWEKNEPAFKQAIEDSNQMLTDLKYLFCLKQTLYIESVSLKSLIDNAVAASLPNPGSLFVDYKSNISELKIDKVFMLQAFKELAMNAIYNNTDPVNNLAVSITIESTDKNVIIRFTDNGKPIKHEDREKIFDIYYTTRKRSGGTGIGLHLVRKIIEKHGGTIECMKPGSDFKFTITLPLKENSYAK